MSRLNLPSRAMPWLISALWTAFATAGAISVVLAFAMLLDPRSTDSGISVLTLNFTTVIPSNLLYSRGQLSRATVSDIWSGDVPAIVSSAATAVEAAASAASTDLQAASSDASAAIQSDLETMVPRNVSIGIGRLCFGWENDTLACHDLPFNLSSIVPEALEELVADPIQQLQNVEDSVVSAIMDTVRGSLIAGIVLLLIFALLLVFWEFPSIMWKRIILTPLGIVCLVVPFLISTVVILLLQYEIQSKTKSSSVISVRDGDASHYGVIGLVFSVLMLAAGVGTTML